MTSQSWEKGASVPDAGTLETVFRDQGQTGGKTAGVFKPDFVNCAVCCGVVKEGAWAVSSYWMATSCSMASSMAR